jgi:deoxyribodipyrimidine photo-lyase
LKPIPDLRLRIANAAPLRPGRDFVLYWMIAARRPAWNFALDRAAEHAAALGKPLVVLEALRADYPWASERLHRFVMDGMAENERAFAGRRVLYYPYVEPEAGAGRGFLEAWAERACVVITDEYPAFFLPGMVERAARRLDVSLEVVDSIGLVPLLSSAGDFPSAYAFRRFLQRVLPFHLEERPRADPLAHATWPRMAAAPAHIAARWPKATAGARLPAGGPSVSLCGGPASGLARWRRFLADGLARYGTESKHPDLHAGSGLSPYLHFGHVSPHQIVHELLEAQEWQPARLGKPHGKRAGFWGVSESAEAFLDQLVTWRELGFHTCRHLPGWDRYESLPRWARATLEKHAADPRPQLYSLAELEEARTHDALWNAAQTQIVRDGVMHNSLRMLWGKKILEWTASPGEALEVAIHLNNKYGLDGRDPNSYSGIFWTLGRYDRPWGPERPVFGTVRAMTSASAAKKLRLAGYLERYGAAGALAQKG